MGFADTFNQQQQKGTDLNGVLGTSMFTSAVPRVAASTSNAGNGVLAATVNSTAALTGHDYSVQFDGTSYNVFDTTTNSVSSVDHCRRNWRHLGRRLLEQALLCN